MSAFKSSIYRRGVYAAALTGVLLAVGACGGARETFGLNKQTPDEFQVTARAPLTLPPDYRLRPPRPGKGRPQEKTTRDAAKEVVIGKSEAPRAALPGLSQGESALLARVGASTKDSAIRATVNEESSILADDQKSLLSRLLFWQKKDPPGQVVDAQKEAKRIQENLALGDYVTKGPVPSIKRRSKGWFEG